MMKRKRQQVSHTNGNDMASGGSSKEFRSLLANQRTRLPPRWTYCPPMGKVVAQKFLPMKTPLDESYDHLIESPKYRFHPQTVFKMPLIGAKEGAKIGIWIDLTNSDNFYHGDEVTVKGCKFVKMKLKGHGEAPSPEQTKDFLEVVDQFFKTNPDDIAVVHCTHGFNRTGFLISAYLFEREGLSIEMAIREFAERRPDGIYKRHYLEELRRRYGDEDDNDDDEIEPGRPLWENGPISDEEFTNEGAFQLKYSISENGSGGLTANAQGTSSALMASSTGLPDGESETNKRQRRDVPLFMDGLVPGIFFVENKELKKAVQEKSRKFCGYNSKGFAGSQPVSLEGPHGNNNLQFLAEEPYMVSWKADGVRCLVLIDGRDQVFAFDRDNNPFRINNMAFVHHRRKEQQRSHELGDDEFIVDTLVDAEMVIDRVEKAAGASSTQEIPRLLIYDLIAFQGTIVREEPFGQRFEMIETELIKPRTEAFKAGRLRREEEPIGVRRKGFWNIESTHKIFEANFLSCHEVDGLIFQPVNRPYTAGRFDRLIKWKPPELSTIDFRLDVKKVQRPGELPEFCANLYVLHLDQPFAAMKATKQLLQYNGKIIECKYSVESRRWEFLRERTDKSHPNALSTANSVLNTIQHPIRKNDLLHFIAKCAYGVRRQGGQDN